VVAGGRDGLRLFAQYAYAPNELGYCGPEDHQALFEFATTGHTDRSIAHLLRGFYGPLPYLRLLAEAAGTGDVFDPRVVEAYWVGNDLLNLVDLVDHADTLAGWFRPGVGGSIGLLADTIAAGSRPHHGFHVFQVYPWVGVLERGHVEEPVRQLDGCRIRWGRVVDLDGRRCRGQQPAPGASRRCAGAGASRGGTGHPCCARGRTCGGSVGGRSRLAALDLDL
jgi:hypothetical protein